MHNESSNISCGVATSFGLSGFPEYDLLTMAAYNPSNALIYTQLHVRCKAFLIFSDVTESGRGRILADYISKHKLGEVYRSPGVRNPNSGNTVEIFTWAIPEYDVLRFHFNARVSGPIFKDGKKPTMEELLDYYVIRGGNYASIRTLPEAPKAA